ncbi:MAG: ORF-3 family protein [Acidimicrobiaceae bacterium]|nr:MAG: ORF-3 family protein [Acidimicrobiaceae bacterium]
MTSHILKVALAHVRPPIWRRLCVPSNTTLDVLHAALQTAFGWEGRHRHEFQAGEVRYGVPDAGDDAPAGLLDEADVSLADVLPRKSSSLDYVYDFGDFWMHHVTVERIEADSLAGNRSLRPRRRSDVIDCLDGARSGPPENCGGPAGYADFLKSMDFMNHAEHADSKEWVGGDFDPELCNIADINRRLAALT